MRQFQLLALELLPVFFSFRQRLVARVIFSPEALQRMKASALETEAARDPLVRDRGLLDVHGTHAGARRVRALADVVAALDATLQLLDRLAAVRARPDLRPGLFRRGFPPGKRFFATFSENHVGGGGGGRRAVASSLRVTAAGAGRGGDDSDGGNSVFVEGQVHGRGGCVQRMRRGGGTGGTRRKTTGTTTAAAVDLPSCCSAERQRREDTTLRGFPQKKATTFLFFFFGFGGSRVIFPRRTVAGGGARRKLLVVPSKVGEVPFGRLDRARQRAAPGAAGAAGASSSEIIVYPP